MRVWAGTTLLAAVAGVLLGVVRHSACASGQGLAGVVVSAAHPPEFSADVDSVDEDSDVDIISSKVHPPMVEAPAGGMEQRVPQVTALKILERQGAAGSQDLSRTGAKDYVVRMVHVITRHGQRTVSDTYSAPVQSPPRPTRPPPPPPLPRTQRVEHACLTLNFPLATPTTLWFLSPVVFWANAATVCPPERQ